jgi:hypothetical protein
MFRAKLNNYLQQPFFMDFFMVFFAGFFLVATFLAILYHLHASG